MTKRSTAHARTRALGTTAIAVGGFAVGSMAMAGGLAVASPGAFEDHSALVARSGGAGAEEGDPVATTPAATAAASTALQPAAAAR